MVTKTSVYGYILHSWYLYACKCVHGLKVTPVCRVFWVCLLSFFIIFHGNLWKTENGLGFPHTTPVFPANLIVTGNGSCYRSGNIVRISEVLTYFITFLILCVWYFHTWHSAAADYINGFSSQMNSVDAAIDKRILESRLASRMSFGV